MEKNNPNTITRIVAKGLLGDLDLEWRGLHPDVNILLGENGTGKTTLLRCLYGVFNMDKKNIFSHIPATQLISPTFPVIKPDPIEKIIKRVEVWGAESLAKGYIFSNGLKTNLSPQTDAKNYNVQLIQTFDTELKYRSEFADDNKPFLRTDLDKTLDNLIDDYIEYVLNQTQKALAKEKTLGEAFAKKDMFVNRLNDFFAPTGKTVNLKENRLSFLLHGQKSISPYELSAGEKQLLIILLTVLCQDEATSILLLDEPEISMHLRWQYRLIEVIRSLNPNCQLIIATHSPSIFTDGWNDRVFWMSDICKKTDTAVL